MTYSATEITAFREELATLRAARTKLQSGRLVTRVIIDGDTVEYHQINIPFLNQRIGELENIINAINNPTASSTNFHFTMGKGL